MALDKEDALFRVDSASHAKGIGFNRAAAKLRRILSKGDCVHIYDRIDAVIVVLKRTPVLYRTEVVAESKNAGGLDSAEYAFFAFGLLCRLFIFNVFHNSSSKKISICGKTQKYL